MLSTATKRSKKFCKLSNGQEVENVMIEQVRELAVEAGKEIARIYRENVWTVSSKADESPITQADLRANEIIVAGLKKFSTDPIVSEEGDVLLKNPSSRFWLVDPLDGTRDFVARKDTFVVCIALIEDGEPILGVIYAPISGELYSAEKGKGARGPQGELLFNRNTNSHLVAAGSRSTPSDRMQALYERFHIVRVERFGSALKFCKVAAGDFDLYPRFGPTKEWDTAAGQIIAEEAGCKVIDMTTGERLTYGKPGLDNRGFVCCRNDLDVAEQIFRYNRDHPRK
jgi:3'(2'), 5'-bisphosphate nucleotidase